jgi:imidazolonepropionase-like amidohydrolase
MNRFTYDGRVLRTSLIGLAVLLSILTLVVSGAQREPTPASGLAAFAIRAGRLVDGRGGTASDVVIRVANGRIVSVGSAPGRVDYDLSALTIMPGLIDVHEHIQTHFDTSDRLDLRDDGSSEVAFYAAGNAWLDLQGGFTTIQSVGAAVDLRLRAAIERGEVAGPRVLTSVRQITYLTGSVNNQTAATPAQLREAVRKTRDDGADLVKLQASTSLRDGGTSTMTAEQLEAACGEARTLGLRTLVHAYGADAIIAAVRAGCNQVEHGTFASDEALRLMAERGTYFDPNIGLVLQNYLANKPRFLGIGNFTERAFAFMEETLPRGTEMFRRALKVPGLKMVHGTDASAGAHGRNAEELIYRVKEGGQAPMDAIVTATSRSAESMRLGGQIGTIAPGMQADIIATDRNPLQDITAVRRVTFVMKGGTVFKNEVPASPQPGATRRTNE